MAKWQKYKMLAEFIGFPFAIGALWHYLGAWAGVPALFVFGVMWLGVLSQISKLDP
jgi:hypothetical protein